MTILNYIEHLIIFILFVISVRYIAQQLLPQKEKKSACSDCGAKCAVTRLKEIEASME